MNKMKTKLVQNENKNKMNKIKKWKNKTKMTKENKQKVKLKKEIKCQFSASLGLWPKLSYVKINHNNQSIMNRNRKYQKNNFSCYILLTDQISLSGCLYVVRY